MMIPNVTSGVEFENFMKDLFYQAGINVLDTPTTNDYGADLILEYRGHRISAQCKFYSQPVGLKAIQEVIASLNVYYCDCGMAITNHSFTQQAVNLAAANNVLLIDGEQIYGFMSDLSSVQRMLNYFIDYELNTENSSSNARNQDWVINDLVIRYGVNSQKLYKDFLAQGLPYYKVGREYRFNQSEVMKWEVKTRFLNVGRNEVFELPAYTAYKEKLYAQLKNAMRCYDKETVKRIKDVIRAQDIPLPGFYTSDRDLKVSIAIGVTLVFSILIYFVIKYG